MGDQANNPTPANLSSTAKSKENFPAGLELYFELEKENIKSPIEAFIVSLHWSVVRAGLRVRLPPSEESTSKNSSAEASETAAATSTKSENEAPKYTEKLPRGWSENGTTDGQGCRNITIDYDFPAKPGLSYQIRVMEVVKDDTLVVSIHRNSEPREPSKSGKPYPKSTASSFEVKNFISIAQGLNSVFEVYHHANDLENKIWSELMEPMGLEVIGLPPLPGPYDDKTKDNEKKNERRPDPLRITYPRPLLPGPSNYFPGGLPPLGGIGGYGRSDLDPLGRIGGGGMTIDPRGNRNPLQQPQPLLPLGAVPPGARFDPFGPPMPNRPLGPGIPGRGGGTGGPNWAVPNPDHEQPPPGFDDMFM